jgi:glutathione-specific gamma-glutamylcyclotransferase
MPQHWIFGYGSLMWRPGFEFAEQAHARIDGYHRSLCIYSLHHRGTEEKPGLVLGLDRGGSCTGVAFRVDPEKWNATLAYLREREQVSMVYMEILQTVELLDRAGRVEVLTYVANRSHAQYAGKLAHDKLLELVQQGEGQMGRCTDYVLNTLTHLKEMDIHDATLEALGDELRRHVSGMVKSAG